MLLAVSSDAVYLRRRPPSGIWGGLWSLPELTDAQQLDEWCGNELGERPTEAEAWPTLRHSFSHYDLDISPVVLRLRPRPNAVADDADALWYRLNDLPPGGIAAPVQKLINKLKKTIHATNG